MNTIEYWKREGFYYVARIHISTPRCSGTITKTLDLVSYYLILAIHGREELMRMAADYNPIGDR